MTAQQDFQSRVDAVFGALDSSENPSDRWSLSETQVYRPGKDADYSSEEEEAAKRDEATQEEVYPLLGLDDEASEGQELPSRAFCKAIDNEQEYDANDVIANGILEQSKEGKPSQQMQVLEDNVFERASIIQQRAALLSSTEEGNLHDSPDGPSESGRRAVTGIVDHEPRSTTRDLPEAGQRQASLGWGTSKPPLPARPAHGQNPVNSRRRSFVPDHVKHPERYTAYELDEPIVIGSGDFAGTDKPQVIIDDVTESRIPAEKETDDNQELPEFGAAIAFQQPRKHSQPTTRQAGHRHSTDSAAVLSVARRSSSPTDDAQDAMMEEASAPSVKAIHAPADFVPKARRQRNLRNRT